MMNDIPYHNKLDAFYNTSLSFVFKEIDSVMRHDNSIGKHTHYTLCCDSHPRLHSLTVNKFVFTFILTVAVIGLSCFGLSQTTTDGSKIFANSIVSLPPGAQSAFGPLTNDARQHMLQLHFSLETNNLSELEARVARGETLSVSELREKYSGNRQALDTLVSWLKGQGFTVTRVSADYTGVYAKATIAQIEKSLGVQMVPVRYRGITSPAAVTAPKLPSEVGNHVVSIEGLQPFVRAVKHTVPRYQALSRNNGKKGGAIPRPAVVSQPTYKIRDILKAYNADGLGLTGDGQTIAILIDTLPILSDLRAFWLKNGLVKNADKVELINVQGQRAPLPPREGEETLDTEWASGIAPAANIRVYAAGSLEFTYLDQALDSIYSDAQQILGLRQVSISLGLREDLVSSGEIQREHALFLRLAALGVTVFVSSGDAGSNPDGSGHGRSPDLQVEYEASDPDTVAVGGTTLQFNRSTGTVIDESGWSDSGGGVSNLFERPSWQSAYGGIGADKRLVPDVSSVADPIPGAFVWLNGKEWPVGGTSWSAPTWAGFWALIGEWRGEHGKAPLGFLPPLVYKTTQGFRDITKGSNGGYSAGVGWDPVTGLGVPNLKELLASFP